MIYGYLKYIVLCFTLSHEYNNNSPSLLNSMVYDGLYTLSVLSKYLAVLYTISAYAV